MRIKYGELNEGYGEREVEHYEQLLCEEVERLMEKMEEKVKKAIQVFCESVNEGVHPQEAYRRALKTLPKV